MMNQITSGGVLAWAKKSGGAKGMQAAVLDMLTELTGSSDKVKISKTAKRRQHARAPAGRTLQQQPCPYHGGRLHMLRQCLKTCVGCDKTGNFKKVYHSRKERVVMR